MAFPPGGMATCVIRRGSGAVGGIASGGTAPTAPDLFNVCVDLSLVHGAVHEASRLSLRLVGCSWRVPEQPKPSAFPSLLPRRAPRGGFRYHLGEASHLGEGLSYGGLKPPRPCSFNLTSPSLLPPLHPPPLPSPSRVSLCLFLSCPPPKLCCIHAYRVYKLLRSSPTRANIFLDFIHARVPWAALRLW